MRLTFALALLLLGSASAAGPGQSAGRFAPDPRLPAELGVPYVILTSDALAPGFQKLADFKRSLGLPAQVVSVDWLAKSPAYPGADLPAKIYQLLKDLRLNWRTRWVLLGGDIDVVPPQRIRAWHGEHGGNQLSCDVYYADILPKEYEDADAVERYDWTGDRWVGDATTGSFDLVPELYVGRIPVETPKELDAYLEKYFEYCFPTSKDPAWLSRALVVGANQFKDNQERVSGLFKELGGAGYSTELLIEKAPDPIAAISTELDKGYAFFDFLCHGCPSHFWAKDDRTSWGVVQLKNAKNEGRYPIVFANSCDTAEFDKPNCLAVQFLTQPKSGAVAYLGYTQVCFQSPVNQAMYKRLFSGECPQLGRALAEAKQELSRDTWMNQILNLFGEPEMWVRTGAPRVVKTVEERLAVNVPARIKVTDAAGAPVRSARVLLEGAGWVAVADSGADGVARLSPPPKAGAARLSVLAQNAARFEKKVTIDAKLPAGISRALPRPAAAVDDSKDDGPEPASADPATPAALRGNNQKDLNPGETVRLVYSWPKESAPPEGGTWTLACPGDPFVKIASGVEKVDAQSIAFRVSVSPKVPPWHQAWFELSWREAEGADPWTWTFRQAVEGPHVTCGAVAVDDGEGNKDKRIGWEDAGKKVRFAVGLFNKGTKKAGGLKVTIATEDPSVTIVKGEVPFGTLPIDDLVLAKDKPFELQLAADYDGHPLAFSVTMEDDRKSKWTGRLVFTVPPAPPVLLKADAGLKSVTLTWVAGGTPGVVGYHVHRGTSEKGPFARLTEQPIKGGTRYPDTAVKPSSTYWYAVTSVTADGLEGRMSAPEKAHTLSPLPKEKGEAK